MFHCVYKLTLSLSDSKLSSGVFSAGVENSCEVQHDEEIVSDFDLLEDSLEFDVLTRLLVLHYQPSVPS